MLCPNCKIEMLLAQTESKYGAKVALDQCPQCGGIWCDGEEMYLARPVEDENYVQFDVAKLTTMTRINNELSCPRDETALKIFSDYNFPKSIQIESCPKCHGFWFNYGQLSAFQKEREGRMAKPKTENDKKMDEMIKKLADTYENTGNYEALGNLGKFLMSPVDGKNYDYLFKSKGSEGFDNPSDWVNFAFQVIYMLLRMLVVK